MEENNSINLQKEQNKNRMDIQQENKEKITFNQWGKEFAQDTNCNPDAISNGLNTVYSDFLKKQKLDKDAIQNKIVKLGDEIENLRKNTEDRKGNNKNLEIANNKHTEDIEVKKEEIIVLENEILDITNGKGAEPDKTKYNLYLTFSIVAFIGVILSYMATFGSAILGLEEDDFLIRGDVFSDLVEAGTGQFILSIFISIIPIACGYFFQKLKREGNHIGAYSTLAIVLIVDAVIGYLLAKTIYIGEYERGLHSEEWKFEYVFSDISFYIILAINFAMYMTFSLLANAFFEEQEKLSPNSLVAQLKNKIDRLKEIIEDFKNKITENKKTIETNLSEINKNNDGIEKRLKDIEDYKNGKLPINIDQLKDLIAQFLKGYQAYANMMIDNEEKSKLIVNKVLENAENWFKNKEQNGWSNDVEIAINKNFFNIK